MTDSDLPHGIFDAEAYWRRQLEVAEKAAEVARRELAALAIRVTKIEET